MQESSAPCFFPPPEQAPRSGLVAFGGPLSVERLLDAYAHGIFPWPLADDTLAWWSPDPRAILPLEEFHLPRRLARTCRSGKFDVRFDRAFDDVVRDCATAGQRRGSTWITPGIQRAYGALHRAGYAHSVEVYRDGRLVGGLYGVALGAMFAAESMFHVERDASNVALVWLVERLRQRGYELLDIQQLTPHLQRFGAIGLSRRQFLARLRAALASPATFA